MNRILTAIIVAAMLASLTLGQAQSQSLAFDTKAVTDNKTSEGNRDEHALRQLENDVIDAFIKSDTDALDRIWADEYSFTAPNGLVVTKENYLALMKVGSLKYEIVKLEELKLRVYGDTATAAGRIRVKGKVGTHIIDGQDRYLTVYVKRQGKWQQVATHSSRIAPQPAQ
jgi:ketosteroid isomerase-like protein